MNTLINVFYFRPLNCQFSLVGRLAFITGVFCKQVSYVLVLFFFGHLFAFLLFYCCFSLFVLDL